LLDRGISSFFGGQSQMFVTPNQYGKGITLPFWDKVTNVMFLLTLHENFNVFLGEGHKCDRLNNVIGDVMLFAHYGMKANLHWLVYGLSDW
jgi:hypothetical protein